MDNELNEKKDIESEKKEQEACENNFENVKNELEMLNIKNKHLRFRNILLSVFSFICVISVITIVVLTKIFIDRYNLSFNIVNNRLNEKTKKDYSVNVATESDSQKDGLIDVDTISKKLNFIDRYVDTFFYYDKDNKAIEDNIFKGYMLALNDKYAEYMPAKTYESFSETEKGEYYGIGATVQQNSLTQEAVVKNVYPDSPAERAGMKDGDIIKRVNGEDVTELDLQGIVDLIKGPEGTEVLVTVEREKENIDLTCIRGKVEIKNVDYEYLEDDIAYVKLTEFTGHASQQFKNAIDNAEEKKAKGLIVDLRNNPGGELTVVLDMLSYVLKENDGKFTLNAEDFVPGRTLLVYMRDKTSIVDQEYVTNSHYVNLPIVILTNGNSASASELFTQCLRDYNMATVVGEKTFGKGVMQNVQPLSDGSAIRLTVAGYFPPSGYDINDHGIVPDYCVDYDGIKLYYDKEGNQLFATDDNEIVIFGKKGKRTENIATTSLATKSIDEIMGEKASYTDKYKKNLDISNEDYKTNQKLFEELDDKYEDKQLLQGIMLLK